VLPHVLDRLYILFIAYLPWLIPLEALAIDFAGSWGVSGTCQGAGGRGADAADTISTAVTQQATANAQAVCGLVGVVAVALAGEDRCGGTRGRVNAGALCIGQACDVGRGTGSRRVERVWVGGEDAEGQGLAAATIVG